MTKTPYRQEIAGPPRGELGRRFLRLITISRPTRALLLWVAGLLAVGAALFLWVTCQQGAALAFDVLAQFKSPIGQDLGVAGMALSIFGFFVVPAAIGAIVGGLYVRTSKVSAGSVAEQAAKIAEQMRAGTPGRGPN